MPRFCQEDGFTLVELMVVVLIIGILVAIAIPVFSAARTTAQTKACFGNQRTIEGAIQMYTAANAAYPPDGAVVDAGWAVPNYLRKAPYCPADDTRGPYSVTTAAVDPCTFGTPAHGHY